MREVREGIAGAGPHPVAGRTGETRLRERFERCLEAVARILEDGHERVPAESAGPQLAKNHGRADGAALFRGRREIARTVRPPQSQSIMIRRRAGDEPRRARPAYAPG